MNLIFLFKFFYLILMFVISFIINDYFVLLILTIIQALILLFNGEKIKSIFRSIKRPFFLLLFLSLSIIIFPGQCENHLKIIHLWSMKIAICRQKVKTAITMVLRIYIIILASKILMAGDKDDTFVQGLKKLHIPDFILYPLSAVLSTHQGEEEKGFRQKERLSFRKLREERLSYIGTYIQNLIKNMEEVLKSQQPLMNSEKARDFALISAFALVTVVTRFLNIMPGIPFAPGHKGLLIIPLFILSSRLIRSGMGGTKFGITAGITSLFLGMGHYGIFEIFKFILPGILSDLIFRGFFIGAKVSSTIIYSVAGVAIAAGRFSTILLIAFLMKVPGLTFAVLAPVFISQCFFGAASGLVTQYLLKLLAEEEKENV